MKRTGSLTHSAQAARDCAEIALRGIAAVVPAASGKFSRLGPFDLRIEGVHRSFDIATVESGVGFAKRGDHRCISGSVSVGVSFADLAHPRKQT
jgi:hypothetical protein